MQSDYPLPPASPTFTPPPGFEPRNNGVTAKKSRLWWIGLGAGVFLAVLILVVVAIALAPGSDKPDPQKKTGGKSIQNTPGRQQTAGDCTETLRQFSNADLGFSFCYPEVWGDVAVQDARFAATDAGSRYRLVFSKKPQVNAGIQSDNWSTTVARDGTCADPATPLPDFGNFSTVWKTQNGGGEVTYAIRGIEVLAGQFLFTEEGSALLGNGVCLHGYKVFNGRAYKHVSASYGVEFNNVVPTPQKHIDNPNLLLPRQERTDFAAFVKSFQAL